MKSRVQSPIGTSPEVRPTQLEGAPAVSPSVSPPRVFPSGFTAAPWNHFLKLKENPFSTAKFGDAEPGGDFILA
jgi:hypothetical protein